MANVGIGDFAADEAGNVVGGTGFEVRVYQAGTDSLATLYVDSGGVTTRANPFSPHAGTETTVRIQPLVGDTLIDVVSTTGFAVGDVVIFRGGGVTRVRVVKAVTDADTLELTSTIGTAFAVGATCGGDDLLGHWQVFVADTGDYEVSLKNTATGKEGPRRYFVTNLGSGIAASIADAKGDLLVASAADAWDNLAVGANDTVLTADSTQALGVKWAAVSGIDPGHGSMFLGIGP